MPAMPPPPASASHRFGHRPVTRARHQAAVAGVFAGVAARYDLMNDLMSAGAHRCWKRRLAALAAPRPTEAWLDLAAGTGDVTALLARRAGHVVAADPAAAMVARGRAATAGARWVRCHAERLPFAAGSFAGVTCAFGLRNFTDRAAGLAEVARVLRPGGRALILEFCPPRGLGAPVHEAYLRGLLPALGAAVAGDAPSYRYLAESIIDFPPPDRVAAMLTAAGLAAPEWRTFAAGAVALLRAYKP